MSEWVSVPRDLLEEYIKRVRLMFNPADLGSITSNTDHRDIYIASGANKALDLLTKLLESKTQ